MTPLLLGVVFGALLDQGGLTRHEKIVGVFRLRDFTLLEFLGSALVVGGLAVQAALSLRLVAAVPIVPTSYAAQTADGAIFGIAMALAGFCPSTILAGAGTGRLDALIPGIGGLLAGAWLARGWTLSPASGCTLATAIGVSPWLLLALLGELALFGFYLLEKGDRT